MKIIVQGRGQPANISGTPGKLVKFETPSTGRDSSMSESGGALSIAGELNVTGRARARTTQGGGWKDLLGPYQPPSSGVSIPVMTQIGSSKIKKPKWQIDDEAQYDYHVPHDYALGTDIYFHLHWLREGTNLNTTKWQLTYYYARGYGVDAFGLNGPGTIITIEQAPTVATFSHMISESSAITIPNFEPDGYLFLHLQRITNGGTNNTDSIFAWNCDIHYQSIEESTANRNGPWGT